MGKIIGVLLIVGGALGLVYGGFTYTKDTHTAKIGPIVLAVQERESACAGRCAAAHAQEQMTGATLPT